MRLGIVSPISWIGLSMARSAMDEQSRINSITIWSNLPELEQNQIMLVIASDGSSVSPHHYHSAICPVIPIPSRKYSLEWCIDPVERFFKEIDLEEFVEFKIHKEEDSPTEEFEWSGRQRSKRNNTEPKSRRTMRKRSQKINRLKRKKPKRK